MPNREASAQTVSLLSAALLVIFVSSREISKDDKNWGYSKKVCDHLYATAEKLYVGKKGCSVFLVHSSPRVTLIKKFFIFHILGLAIFAVEVV